MYEAGADTHAGGRGVDEPGMKRVRVSIRVMGRDGYKYVLSGAGMGLEFSPAMGGGAGMEIRILCGCRITILRTHLAQLSSLIEGFPFFLIVTSLLLHKSNNVAFANKSSKTLSFELKESELNS